LFEFLEVPFDEKEGARPAPAKRACGRECRPLLRGEELRCGSVELGEEAPTENDAMVTAFRTGGTFAVVTEWKTTVDLTDGRPVIKKEAVRREKSLGTNIGSHDVGRGDPQPHAEKLLAGNTRTSVLPPVPATDSKGVGR
jgi:hypothetical protein